MTTFLSDLARRKGELLKLPHLLVIRVVVGGRFCNYLNYDPVGKQAELIWATLKINSRLFLFSFISPLPSVLIASFLYLPFLLFFFGSSFSYFLKSYKQLKIHVMAGCRPGGVD